MQLNLLLNRKSTVCNDVVDCCLTSQSTTLVTDQVPSREYTTRPSKQTRLTKPPTHGDISSPKTTSGTSPPSKSTTNSDHNEPMIRLSFSDVRKPKNARESLRAHLLDDTPRRSSLESPPHNENMGETQDRLSRTASLTVGQNASAKSSSTSVNSTGAKRLSAVHESEAQTIDLAKAIELLQQLKQQASPEELVALHRALLPTREIETVKSPTVPEADESGRFVPPSMTRRRSLLPAGLATRGGATQDLLRKPLPPAAAAERPKPMRPYSEQQLAWSQSAPVTDLVALDLADDKTNPLGHRAATPSLDRYSATGALKLGSLRVMNGAASPEPSITSRIAEKNSMLSLRDEDGYVTASEGRPSLDVPLRNSVDEIPIRERILKSAKAQQDRARRNSRQSFEGRPIVAPIRDIPLKLDVPRYSSEDDAGTSPRTNPRIQRLKHRASAYAQEYASDCELSPSPYDERAGLLSVASRLSTVYDSADNSPNDRAAGTPEEALSKLTGVSDYITARPLAAPEAPRESSESAQSIASARTRPSLVTLQDSGYSSETSLHVVPRKPSWDIPRKPSNMHPATEEALKQVVEQDECPSSGKLADEQSLYTFEEFLSSPMASLQDEKTPTPSPDGSAKKQPRFYALRNKSSVKRSSMPAMPGLDAKPSTDTIPTIASTQSSPAQTEKTEHISKQQRKLQKPRPSSHQVAKKVRVTAVKDIKPDSLPAVPDEVSVNFSRRIQRTPSMAHLEHTYASTDSKDVAATPVEFDGSIKFPSPTPSPEPKRSFSKRVRSRSRGRKRDTSKPRESVDEVLPDSDDDSPLNTRSGSVFRLRSKSRSRSRTMGPRRSSGEARTTVSEDFVAQFSDFGVVAATLGSSPYDISTNKFERRSGGGGAKFHPHQISTGLKTEKTSVPMNEEAAAELARAKSRDRAGESMAGKADRPRTAQPRSRSASRPKVSVEDLFPEWKGSAGRDASRDPPPAMPMRPSMRHRPHSMYAESIPPLPDLPADVEVKVSKAEKQLLAKLSQESTKDPPVSKPEDVVQQPPKEEYLQSSGQPARKTMEPINIAVREIVGSDSEASSVAGAGESAGVVHEQMANASTESFPEQPASPTHQAMHPGWPGWETQARLWRERRQSLGRSLQKAPTIPQFDTAMPIKSSPPTPAQPSQSPAIVVSRYITPLSQENAARANVVDRPTDAAATNADLYQGLITSDDKENRPAKIDVPRTDSAVSAATFVTVASIDNRPAKEDVPRTDSAVSAATYRTAASKISRVNSPQKIYHKRTPSGQFRAFRPGDAEVAERSRAASLAKLTSPASASASDLRSTTQSKANRSTDTIDRYSGGLQYGWERGTGFGGSAGTRSSGDAAKRKSVQLSSEFGVDLSDVPVYLMRVPNQ